MLVSLVGYGAPAGIAVQVVKTFKLGWIQTSADTGRLTIDKAYLAAPVSKIRLQWTSPSGRTVTELYAPIPVGKPIYLPLSDLVPTQYKFRATMERKGKVVARAYLTVQVSDAWTNTAGPGTTPTATPTPSASAGPLAEPVIYLSYPSKNSVSVTVDRWPTVGAQPTDVSIGLLNKYGAASGTPSFVSYDGKGITRTFKVAYTGYYSIRVTAKASDGQTSSTTSRQFLLDAGVTTNYGVPSGCYINGRWTDNFCTLGSCICK